MRRTIFIVLLSLSGAGASPALAAPFVYRELVLPHGEVVVDFGLGVGHVPDDAVPGTPTNGLGLNLEIVAGIAPGLELGLRTGFRLDEGGQRTQADGYGRPFDTETYGTQFDRVANPELHLRWLAARGPNAELGLQLDFYLPTENGSRFGMMFALPIVLRGGPVRLDTGIYVPVIFYDPTLTIISVPLHVWIQATPRLWLGPLFGVRVIESGGSHTEAPMGFGIGTALDRAVDLRAWFLFPDVSHNGTTRVYGGGVALQLRF
ncbi:MAG TPA: hypothetical protein VGP07_25110 [Polyangia bacterium]|jgi:hypothetical protein